MAAPAFGLLCCGRPIQTDYQTIDDARIVFTVNEVNTVKHIVVFLTGSITLPQGHGAAIYFLWPNEEGQVSSKYLGHLTNEKPSAMFRLSRFHHATPSAGQEAFMAGLPSPLSSAAQIGISLEPIDTINGYSSDPSQSTETHAEFTQYAAENLFNFVSSFAKPISSVCPGVASSESVVPLSAVQQWFTKFSERLKIDPNFWKN